MICCFATALWLVLSPSLKKLAMPRLLAHTNQHTPLRTVAVHPPLGCHHLAQRMRLKRKNYRTLMKTITKKFNEMLEQSLYLALNNSPSTFSATFLYQLYLLFLSFSTFFHPLHGYPPLPYVHAQLIPSPLI